jgi:hypothetical protein
MGSCLEGFSLALSAVLGVASAQRNLLKIPKMEDAGLVKNA